MILEKFSAALEERFQIRISGVDGIVIGLFRSCDVACEVERLVIPIGIFEDDVLEVIGSRAERPRPGLRSPCRVRCPA